MIFVRGVTGLITNKSTSCPATFKTVAFMDIPKEIPIGDRNGLSIEQ